MPAKAIQEGAGALSLSSFIVNEVTAMNGGFVRTTSIYQLEEIANRPGTLRVTQFCPVNSEDEGRAKLKRFISLRVMLGLIDRKGVPVGNLNEITMKAKTIAMNDCSVVSEEDDDSCYDNGIDSVKGEIEQTEDGARSPMIEEAKNSGSIPHIEEVVKEEPFEEDLTLPPSIMHIDDVPDWEDRMDRASYTSSQRDIIKQCLDKKDRFLNFMENGPWEVADTNKKDNYEISLCTGPNGVPCLKSSGVF